MKFTDYEACQLPKQTLILELRRSETLDPPVGAETPKDVTFGLLTEGFSMGPSSFWEGNCGGLEGAAGTALGTRFGTWSTLFMYALPMSKSVVTTLGICTDLTDCVY